MARRNRITRPTGMRSVMGLTAAGNFPFVRSVSHVFAVEIVTGTVRSQPTVDHELLHVSYYELL